MTLELAETISEVVTSVEVTTLEAVEPQKISVAETLVVVISKPTYNKERDINLISLFIFA